MPNRSTNAELQEKYEFAAQLIGEGHSKSQIVKTLVEEYGVTPQQARTYKREGTKIFRETIYETEEGGNNRTTVADAIELDFMVKGDKIKEDILKAAEAENWTAVASMHKTHLKHIEMARVIAPESFWAKDEENYCKAVVMENVEENFPSKRPKGYISGQRETNTNKPVSELLKECPF